MGRILTERDVEAAVLGGSVYAAGGGGWADHGRMLGQAAMSAGRPELVSIDEVDPDAYIATAAAIGAPAGLTKWEMQPADYVRAAELLQRELKQPIAGFMIGQNGRSSTLNAWLPAVALNAKVIDAVGDVRAHPTSDMGSIGLAGSPEETIQTAAGGNRAENRYIELVTRGATAKVSPILRTAADMAGGFIASCRAPVRASYVRQHAALGGISLALELGAAIKRAAPAGAHAVLDAICMTTGGAFLIEGSVSAVNVVYTKEAFDIGTVDVASASSRLRLHVMNEYMAVDDEHGERTATFPDVISTLGAAGEPLSVGQLKPGMKVFVLHVPKGLIPLASSVLDPAVYPYVERALGIEIARYALPNGARE